MNKKILLHTKFIETEIEKLKKELNKPEKDDKKSSTVEKVNNLNNYHNTVVQNFQHERLIHLIITIFFAAMLFLAIAGLFFITSISSSYVSTNLLTILASAIVIILFITELFYVRYYFQLENGTQSLYKYTEILYQMAHKDE